MQDILVVVDMQNDFVTGALGSRQAQTILPGALRRAKEHGGKLFFTMDTHGEEYLRTQEGRMLPVPHCIRGTEGWRLCDGFEGMAGSGRIEKGGFGSVALGQRLLQENSVETIRSVTFVGLCTDVCVISNALLVKAFLPEAEIRVDASCCAGSSGEGHRTALRAMRACQIRIENAPADL